MAPIGHFGNVVAFPSTTMPPPPTSGFEIPKFPIIPQTIPQQQPFPFGMETMGTPTLLPTGFIMSFLSPQTILAIQQAAARQQQSVPSIQPFIPINTTIAQNPQIKDISPIANSIPNGAPIFFQNAEPIAEPQRVETSSAASRFASSSPDPNLPPVLEPELPCDFADIDEFCSPPDLLPALEAGPPLLEPQVERQPSRANSSSIESQFQSYRPVIPSMMMNPMILQIPEDRKRSASVESDSMAKMPKLIPMNEIEESIAEEEEETEWPTSPPNENITPEPIECSAPPTVEAMDISAASSSGVSSAESALSPSITKEEIIEEEEERIEEKIEEKPIEEKKEEIKENRTPTPKSPLASLQNTVIPNQTRSQPPPKLRKHFPPASRRRNKRSKSVAVKSNWSPLDEGRLQDIRLCHESQSQRRRCFAAIRHCRERDEIIRIRDCVKVCSSEGLENIGKIIRLFLDDSSGAICAQVLWYYTEAQAPGVQLHEKELLASKHCDVINADAIEEHAFVLTFSEYCRFVAETRIDEMPPERRPLDSREIWPRGEEDYQRRPRLPHEDTPVDLVYFCRSVYSLRTRKILSSVVPRRGSNSRRR